MDSLKTKTAKYHVVFNFVSIICTSICMVSHLQQCAGYLLITCVYEYTVVEWPHTSDEYHA